MRHYASISLLVVSCLAAVLMSGCTGMVTMPESARAGDTISLGAGWKHSFNRNNITVTITDADNNTTTYQPGDPAIRSVINLYPDPASYLSVGTKIGGGVSSRYSDGYTWGTLANANVTGDDPDWWESMIYLDLPTTMATGQATIMVTSPTETYGPVPVNIIPGTGSRATFQYTTDTGSGGSLTLSQMQSMERAPVRVVTFSGGASLPDAIQVQLTHDPDAAAGGTGVPHVINPVSDMKNLTWTDDGQNLKVLVYPNGDGTENDPNRATYGLKLYKFYVAGEVQNLAVSSVSAYDADGNPITGVIANITSQ
jgi:hypothetical protein